MRGFVVVALSGLLLGCAGAAQQQSLTDAQAHFAQLQASPDASRYAPKDVARAGESLARAERLSAYIGSADDVAHYAYLSQRYSEIARLRAEFEHNQQKRQQRERELARLQLLLSEAQLLKAQDKGAWLEEQMLSLSTNETDRGLVMTLGDVLFETGSSELLRSAHPSVVRLARFSQINPRRSVRIEGYTDSVGKAELNQQLSLNRAQSVAQALIDLGIDSRRVQVRGYGEAHPVAENASSRGRAQNRRVEVVFSNEQGQLGAER